jgi:UDP-glucose 4-epimerase
MNWLVTGGCGFIGSCLIYDLLADGDATIRTVDNFLVGTREDLAKACAFTERDPARPSTWGTHFVKDRVELIPGDILDDALARKLAEGMDVIVHLAGNTGVGPSVVDPRADCMNNVIGILNYLEAARHAGCRRFVFASSGATVGECEPPLHEEMPAHPVSPYGASKVAGEAYCSAYKRSFGIDAVALRFSNVYGPLSSHKSSLVARCIRRVMRGLPIEIYGDGSNTRDFLYTEDLVRAIRAAASVPGIGGEVFQIATNEETSVNQLVNMLKPVLEKAGFTDIAVEYTEKRTGDVGRNFADTRKASRLLGWKPRMRLKDGLGRTVEYFMGIDPY